MSPMFSTLAISYRVQFIVVSVHCWVQSVSIIVAVMWLLCACAMWLWWRRVMQSVCLSVCPHRPTQPLVWLSAPLPASAQWRHEDTCCVTTQHADYSYGHRFTQEFSCRRLLRFIYETSNSHSDYGFKKTVLTIFKWVAAMLKRRRISKTHVFVVPQRPLTQFSIESKPKRFVQIFILSMGPL